MSFSAVDVRFSKASNVTKPWNGMKSVIMSSSTEFLGGNQFEVPEVDNFQNAVWLIEWTKPLTRSGLFVATQSEATKKLPNDFD